MSTSPRIAAVIALAVLVVSGCATHYDLTLMPRTSGTLYKGEAYQPAGAGEAQVSILIEGKGYAGTWVVTASDYQGGYFSAGVGFGGRRGGFGMATVPVVVEPAGSDAKALLRAADGSGLRCDFKGVSGGRGSGTCQDDQGILYDVQIRLRNNK
jgi:hypothetical protein